MYTDSHTHIKMTKTKLDDYSSAEMMKSLKNLGFRFVLDIGTEPGDLKERMECVKEISFGEIPSFVHFSVGLWPHTKTIEKTKASLEILEKDIKMGLEHARKHKINEREGKAFFALGECGLDRYWNGENAPMLKEGGTVDIEGEENLFIEQLKLAKKYNLAVIIHSREAYAPTIKCIDKVGYHKGVIHCYSYGIEEAKTFLERGWYISFPGNITFAKTKVAIQRTHDLVSSIPLSKLLLETDAPYMTPVPLRGTVNTSVKIEHTYKKASEYLGVSVEELCDVVYNNCSNLFNV